MGEKGKNVSAEKALEISEKRYETVFEYTGTGMMVLKADMTISLINRRVEEMTGYSKEKVENRKKWTGFIAQDDLTMMKDYHTRRRQASEGAPAEYEFRYIDSSGEKRYAIAVVSMIPGTDDSLVSLLDIDERKNVEKMLRESRKRFMQTAELLPGIICEIDKNLNFTYVNKYGLDIFGYTQDDVENGRVTLTDLVVKEDLERLKENASLLISGGSVGMNEYRLRHKSGETRTYLTRTAHMESDGEITGFRSCLIDITERKKAQEQLMLIERDKTEKARKEAKKADRIARQLRKELYESSVFHNIVSRSPAMKKILNILPQLSRTSTSVLITGESGTGKELIARALHEIGDRKEQPFIAVNCGALPDNLLESELFGYKAGAFTDAKKDKPGKFKLADRGTIFLDEVGDVSQAMQVKLLRVLQEKTIEPLGSSESEKIDVRVLAATNRGLADMVENGGFRKDLYYRIKIVNVELPPLRERRADIPLLAQHFISKFNAAFGKDIQGISENALDVLLKHDFPGNIRELENIIEHAFIFCSTNRIEREHLPGELRDTSESPENKNGPSLMDVKDFDQLEKEFIKNVLQETGGSRIKAAQRLGIHKTTLFRKMKRLGIQ